MLTEKKNVSQGLEKTVLTFSKRCQNELISLGKFLGEKHNKYVQSDTFLG